MTVSELNIFHTVCELERTQLLTILAVCVKTHKLLVFSQHKIAVVSIMLKTLQLSYMIALIAFHLFCTAE